MGIFKNILKKVGQLFRRLKFSHYIVLVLILGIGIFNGITGLAPYLKQQSREKNIEKTFDQWWKDAGAEQFRSVGLEPTEKIRNEEFQSYREKYLSQNQAIQVEERVEEIKKELREKWEIGGGKDEFAMKNGRYPSEEDFTKLEEKEIRSYTQQFLRYNMAFTPKIGNHESLLTSWLLSPSIYSFITFAFFFTFAFVQLRRRWHLWIFLGTAVLALLCGGILVDFLLSTSFFHRYIEQRYMGMSMALTFVLGAAAFGPKRLEISQKITAIAIVGLILDILVNWMLNPGLYRAVAISSLAMFGLGALAGLKIETRRKTREEQSAEALEERLRSYADRNPIEERKAKTRSYMEDGFKAAKEGMHDNAHRLLSQAFNALLQEHPLDKALVIKFVERLTSSSLYVDFASNQWLEWGEIVKTKNTPEAAIKLLKKGLSLEKDAHFARRALFTLGEICVNNKIELQDGVNRLKKVIEMNGNDMMAKQARRMLDALEPKENEPSKE